MKKFNAVRFGLAAAALSFALVLAACGSNPQSAPASVSEAPAPAPVQDDLDLAVRETSDYLNRNVPKGSRIAILNVQSASPALSDYIIDELIANAVNDRVFVVIDRQQLNLIRGELDFQYSGDVDDNSAQAIGRMIGAEVVISGAVGKYGDMYRMRIRALAVQTAQVQGQFNRNIPDGSTIAALMSSSAVGYSSGTAPAPRQTAQSVPAPAAPVQVIPVQAPPVPPAPVVPAVPPAPVVYKIGDTGPAGGIVFYDKGSVTNGWRYLEAAPAEAEFSAPWGGSGNDANGTGTAVGTSRRNMAVILEWMGEFNVSGTAAHLCANLEFGGYRDWMLPSKDELDLMYKNLEAKAPGSFRVSWYWSSSQSSGSYAHSQRFSDGRQDTEDKSRALYVRAIRAF